MYITKPLSLYRRSPSALSETPPGDSPSTGILVIKDDESEAEDTSCCGICDHESVDHFPFPQNKIFSIFHHQKEPEQESNGGTGSADGGGGRISIGGRIVSTKVWFLPVLNQPLSSNLYYVIRATGRYKGKACTSLSRMDPQSCCWFGTLPNDRKPKPLDFRDPYQQFEMRRHHSGGFYAKSVAHDGVPPSFLRRKGWHLRTYSQSSITYHTTDKLLDAALGIDNAASVLVAPLPVPPKRLSFVPAANYGRRFAPVMGRWYCPFVFVEEQAALARRMEKSLLYEISLEQHWEGIFSRDNPNDGHDGGGYVEGENNDVEGEQVVTMRVDVSVDREEILVYGGEAVREEVDELSGLVWFKVKDDSGSLVGDGRKLGLSLVVVEGMRRVEVVRGWRDTGVGGEDLMDVRVQRQEAIALRRSSRDWKRFECYVLVESFLVRRMDGFLVMKYKFRHTHKVQCKWE